MAQRTRTAGRVARHKRVRTKVAGTAERPRLSVFRSLSHIYAQVIDDRDGRTIAAASSAAATGATKAERAAATGTQLAERARAAGVRGVVFDRGGYRYHGRVKALAEAARKGGLEF